MIYTLVMATAMSFNLGDLPPGDHTRTIEVGGRTREYLVHVPPGYDGKKATPVMLVFHGGASNPEQMVTFSGMSDKADKAGFLAVYPRGSGRFRKLLTFNGGNCCGYAMNQGIDDVAFVSALLDDLEKAANVDKKRVFATGMSNGAIISYLLASKLADRIAAIAPVGGPMGTETCKPSRPVPVIHFHGSDDEFAPFTGGKGKKSISQTDFLSVQHSIDAWIKANGCSTTPRVEKQPDRAGDGTTIVRKTYSGGRQGSEVVLVIIEGGGHTWPGRQSPLRYLGASTSNLSANDVMWDFFQRHPMK